MYRPFSQVVRSRRTAFAITGCICIVAWTTLSGELQQAPAHRIPLAVIDVAKVFKEAQAFNKEMQRMKLEIEAFDRNLQARRGEATDQLPPGLKAEVEAKKAAFLADEATAYAETYREVENAVQSICRGRDIGIVIRFISDPMNPKDRSSVLQGVNKPVIYSVVPDLTADVVAALNKSSQ